MIKGQRYLGNDKNGIPIIEFYDVEETTSQHYSSYDETVSELIRQKYSLDDEIAITNNRMSVFDANLLTAEKEEEYNHEYYEYQIFREECKKKARYICGITK